MYFHYFMYIHCFVIISPWKRAGSFIWTDLKPLLEKKIFFNFVDVCSLFHNYLPWNRTGPFVWTNLNFLLPRMLCAKFGWDWLSGSGEEDKNVKSLQTDGRTDRRKDDGRQVIRKAHLSFQLRWAYKPVLSYILPSILKPLL